MGFLELTALAMGLSMDAFAVSVCKGLSLREVKPRHMVCAGAWFGGFQALMPLLGYFFGMRFESVIGVYDHWIAFTLLTLIGSNMIKEAMSGKADDMGASMGVKTMLMSAVATSIDALAVGVTLAFLEVRIIPACAFIGCMTFALSAAGTKLGSIFGLKYKSRAEICGGIILILLGLKILAEGIWY